MIVNVVNKEDNLFSQIMKRIRGIGGRISKSSKGKRILRERSGKVITTACPTRWWTELACIQRILEIEEISPGKLTVQILNKGKGTIYYGA